MLQLVKEKPTEPPSTGSSDLQAAIVLLQGKEKRDAFLSHCRALGGFCLPLSISANSLPLSDLMDWYTRYVAQREMKMTVWARLLAAVQ